MLSRLPPHQQPLLQFLGTPKNLQGAYIAADQLASSFESAHRTFGPHLPAEWVEQTHQLVGTLHAMAIAAGNAHIANRVQTGHRGYDQFIDTHKVGVPRAISQKINAAFGLIAAHCMSQARGIPPNIIDGWEQLLRVGRHRRDKNPEWEHLAKTFPIDIAAVKAWQLRSGIIVIQDFLHEYAQALSKPIPPLSVRNDTAPKSGDIYLQEYSTNNTGTHEQSPDLVSTGTEDANENLIGWLLQRANHSGYISFFGESNRWERLSVDELRTMCDRITPHLITNDPNCNYALLAVLSLCSSLPIKKALTLRLQPNNKIWIDPVRKAIRWNLRAVLDQNEPLSDTAPDPGQTIDKVTKMNGMDITFVTSANTDEEAYALLEALGMPFTKKQVATN